MTDAEDDGYRRASAFSRRRLLAAAGATTFASVTGCLGSGGDEDGTVEPSSTAPGKSPTATTTSSDVETPSTTTSHDVETSSTTTSSSQDCRTQEAAVWALRVGFEPTIESVTAEELHFCVGPAEWGRAGEKDPFVIQTPVGDGDDNCYNLAPNETSDYVWERWGISPCTYDTLGLNIGASVEALRYSDEHPEHDHVGSVEGGLVQWDLGQSGDPVQVDSDDVFDITVYLDVVEGDGQNEFELQAGGLTGI